MTLRLLYEICCSMGQSLKVFRHDDPIVFGDFLVYDCLIDDCRDSALYEENII